MEVGLVFVWIFLMFIGVELRIFIVYIVFVGIGVIWGVIGNGSLLRVLVL